MRGLKRVYGGGAALVFALALGCGTEAPLSAELELPTTRPAELAVTAALDVSEFDPALAARIRVDEIHLGLTEARLLGAHPSLPPGGLPLLREPQVVTAIPGAAPAWATLLPARYLHDEGLAVYFRLDRLPDLEDAAVIVRGRLYAQPLTTGLALTAATDPDGDPAHDGQGATDPDGDPAHDDDMEPVGATDPDGDPAIGGERRALTAVNNPWMQFELRDPLGADLVATIQDPADLSVVLAIPARRWLSPERIERLVGQLNASHSLHRSNSASGAFGQLVLEAQSAEAALGAGRSGTYDPNGFFVSNQLDEDRLLHREPRP